MNQYKAYGNRLIVTKQETPPIKSAGGALLGSGDVALGERAIVIEAGNSCTDVKKGHIVIYPPGSAKEIYLDGEIFHTLLEHEIYFFKSSSDQLEDREL